MLQSLGSQRAGHDSATEQQITCIRKPPEVSKVVLAFPQEVSVAPHLCHHYLLLLFFNDSFSGEWMVLFHCNFNFPDNDVEHIFTCLMAISASTFVKYLSKTLAHFVIGLLLLNLLLSICRDFSINSWYQSLYEHIELFLYMFYEKLYGFCFYS